MTYVHPISADQKVTAMLGSVFQGNFAKFCILLVLSG